MATHVSFEHPADVTDPVEAGGDVHSPPPGYGMVPAWLAWRRPSANAVLVYVHLALFGKFNTGWQVYDECRPSLTTLVDGGARKARDGYPGTGLSKSTVQRALNELIDLHAAEGIPQFDPVTGAQQPTVYRLIHNNPGLQTTSPVFIHDQGALVAHDQGPYSPVTTKLEPHTQNQEELEEVSKFPSVMKKPLSSGSASPDPAATPSAEREVFSREKNDTDRNTVIQKAIDLAAQKRPAWGASVVRKVVAAELAQREPAVVAAAWGYCLGDPATTSPRRFPEAGPWWDRALNTTVRPSRVVIETSGASHPRLPAQAAVDRPDVPAWRQDRGPATVASAGVREGLRNALAARRGRNHIRNRHIDQRHENPFEQQETS